MRQNRGHGDKDLRSSSQHGYLSPERTVARVKTFATAFGITRIANLTGLDRTGVPVVMVCRPNARSSAVFNGKGVDLASAQASALMEAAETWHAENIRLPLQFASFADLRQAVAIVDIDGLPRMPGPRFDPHLPILWIEGRNLMDESPGPLLPYALNFDVMAHELGHLIIYSTIGVPSPSAQRGEYYGFQELAADTTALIAALHFELLMAHLLEETHGNLYVFNELDRFAELSTHDEIRLASNDIKLSRFAAGWDDEHALSQPLTGAIFDISVDIFQELLVERGLIARDVAEATRRVRDEPEIATLVQPAFEAAFANDYDGLRAALADARDYVGFTLAETWKRLQADNFSYVDVAETLIAMDQMMSGGRYRRAIVESFVWREIGSATVGPRLRPPDARSHTYSARTVTPEFGQWLPKMTYRERAIAAGILR